MPGRNSESNDGSGFSQEKEWAHTRTNNNEI